MYIAKNCKFYLDSQLIVKTHIIGGCDPTGDGSQRTAIGAAKSITDSMTVLDGNSLRHPRRVEKHRVATVNAGGIIENCLIRNGHARGITNNNNDLNGHGGGVLLNGGKLYNCIIRGNVAMNVQYQSTNKSSGGGVYITNNGGQVVNCIIAFNMDDRGVGIDGKSGESINNTVAYNTQTPTWKNIPMTNDFQHYQNSTINTTPTGAYMHLDAFYMANTECTGGQYACFMSAIDFDGTNKPYLKLADKNAMVAAQAPAAGYSNGITVEQYALLTANGAGVSSTPGTIMWNLVLHQANNSSNLRFGGCLSGETVSYKVWFPLADKLGTSTETNRGKEALRRDNYPISYVSWYGGLAFSLWLGGCLPTEAQWEYAARRSTSGMNNTLYAGSSSADGVGWHSGNSKLNGNGSTAMVHEVAKKDSNGIGLYDMSGNLWELVLDMYSSGSYLGTGTGVGVTTPTSGKWLVSGNVSNTGASSGSPLYNPVQFGSGFDRVLRGGDCTFSSSYCSLGYRYARDPSTCGNPYGFRSVCVP
ncbi:MAG: formylglycine-generating enzyme family protein [Bacteroidales bacterium]|nr:formylglycine-generating enzyme family protein [Bacteroidales bacterium]